MSPLRGRKIRRIYINSEDNYNENGLNKINNLNCSYNCGYDDNYRLNHFRKLSKLSGLNTSEITGSNNLEKHEGSMYYGIDSNNFIYNKEAVNMVLNDRIVTQGINIKNLSGDDLLFGNGCQENMYIKNLSPMQLKYLQNTQKILSYELSNYKSGIKQLLSIPEYLPCDM
ncbi:hypothetical protein HWI79_3711 [Cryptosporidium felis]|nr:hypothetical protein HWI79_3711 [Cryptosporidium felis]